MIPYAVRCLKNENDNGRHSVTRGSAPNCYYCNQEVKLTYNIGGRWNPEFATLLKVIEWP